jgi:hypothetical protein
MSCSYWGGPNRFKHVLSQVLQEGKLLMYKYNELFLFGQDEDDLIMHSYNFLDPKYHSFRV